jgi:hypothetical protein
MGQFRVQISPMWLTTAIVVFGLNLAGVFTALELMRYGIVTPLGPGGPNFLVHRTYDGSVVYHPAQVSGGRRMPIVIQPASAIGFCQVWWTVAVSIVASLLILGLSWIRSRRRSLKALRRPRLTMMQSMVLVGLISFWLWLMRFDASLIVVGFVVLVLMLHSAYRRSKLVEEPKAAGTSEIYLSRAGIAGYSIAVLLALAWMISILVWDSYEGIRR